MPTNPNELNEIIAGRNAVSEAVRSGRAVEFLMVAQGASGSVVPIVAECKKRGIIIKEVPRQKLDMRLPGINHQGVALLVSAVEYSTVEDILQNAVNRSEPPLILVLDELEDPHNLGAVIRTAEAAGVHGIILPKRRSVGLSGTVAKVASGALEYVPVARVANLAATLEQLKKSGVWIYGADMDGESVYNTDLSGPAAIVIGSEGSGIGRLVREKCDFLIKIPMLGKINSLNASVAAGVLMYEAVRHRINK